MIKVTPRGDVGLPESGEKKLPSLLSALREVDERFAQKKPGREVEEHILRTGEDGSRLRATLGFRTREALRPKWVVHPHKPLRAALRTALWAVPALGVAMAVALSQSPTENPTASDLPPTTTTTLSVPVAAEKVGEPLSDTAGPPKNVAPLPILAPQKVSQPAEPPLDSEKDRRSPDPTNNKSYSVPDPNSSPKDLKGAVAPSGPTGQTPAAPSGKRAEQATPSGNVVASAPVQHSPSDVGATGAAGAATLTLPRALGDVPKGSGKAPLPKGPRASDPSNWSGEANDDSANGEEDKEPSDGVELHVFGIYDSYSPSTGKDGFVNVHIDRPGKHVIFLSTYSETEWRVTAGPGVVILRVFAAGYESQSIASVPAGSQMAVIDYEGEGSFLGCGYEFPDKSPTSGCETLQLLSNIESLVGMNVSSFHGCYAASAFALAADMSATSDCWVDGGYSLTGFP